MPRYINKLIENTYLILYFTFIAYIKKCKVNKELSATSLLCQKCYTVIRHSVGNLKRNLVKDEPEKHDLPNNFQKVPPSAQNSITAAHNFSQSNSISVDEEEVNFNVNNINSQGGSNPDIETRELIEEFGQDTSQETVARTETSCQVAGSSVGSQIENSFVEIPIPSTSSSQSQCFLCNKKVRTRVPQAAIEQVWMEKGIRVPKNNRCCSEHLIHKVFKPEALNLIKVSNMSSKMRQSEVSAWVMQLTRSASNQKSTKEIDFDTMDADRFISFTGLTKTDFTVLVDICKPSLHFSKNRSPANAVGMLLMKLRLDLSHAVLGQFFNIKSHSVVCISYHGFYIPFTLTFFIYQGERHYTYRSKGNFK